MSTTGDSVSGSSACDGAAESANGDVYSVPDDSGEGGGGERNLVQH